MPVARDTSVPDVRKGERGARQDTIDSRQLRGYLVDDDIVYGVLCYAPVAAVVTQSS